MFGVKDTLACLDMGAVETLIVWEDLSIQRFTLMTGDGEVIHKILTEEQSTDSSHFVDKATGGKLEVQEQTPMLEWLASEYKKFGCQLEFVTNRSQEGSQFCRGFGGIGGILRYPVDLTQLEEPEDADEFSDSDSEGGESDWDSDLDFM